MEDEKKSGGVQMIRTRMQGDTPFFPNMLNNGKVEVCLKEDVDRLLDEKDAEIARLKAIRKVHIEAIESMGAGLQQDEEEIHYPLHPGQTHAEPYYCTIPLEEYERIMTENRRMKEALKRHGITLPMED